MGLGLMLSGLGIMMVLSYDAFGMVGYCVAALSFNATPTVTRQSGHTVNTMATYRFGATINTSNGAAIKPNTSLLKAKY